MLTMFCTVSLLGPLDEVISVSYDSANIKFTLTQVVICINVCMYVCMRWLTSNPSNFQEPNSGIKVTHPLDLENLRDSQEWYD